MGQSRGILFWKEFLGRYFPLGLVIICLYEAPIQEVWKQSEERLNNDPRISPLWRSCFTDMAHMLKLSLCCVHKSMTESPLPWDFPLPFLAFTVAETALFTVCSLQSSKDISKPNQRLIESEALALSDGLHCICQTDVYVALQLSQTWIEFKFICKSNRVSPHWTS